MKLTKFDLNFSDHHPGGPGPVGAHARGPGHVANKNAFFCVKSAFWNKLKLKYYGNITSYLVI